MAFLTKIGSPVNVELKLHFKSSISIVLSLIRFKLIVSSTDFANRQAKIFESSYLKKFLKLLSKIWVALLRSDSELSSTS